MIQLLLLKDNRYVAKSISLGRRGVGLLCCTAASLVALTAYYSFQLGQGAAFKVALEQPQVQAWKTELKQHQDMVVDVKKQSLAQIENLQQRVALLQSHIIRLNALGQRLVDIAQVDEKEFNFDSQPPIGGPDDSHWDEGNLSYTDFLNMLNQAEETLAAHNRKFGVLESFYRNSEYKSDTYINGKPVHKGWVSSFYGSRTDPFHGRKAWHAGIDIAGREGSKVIAVGSGVVTYASKKSGYGNLVEIDHGNGYVTRYAHNKSIKVKAGESIEKGQSIALMGSTGRSTGPHVHFEVLRNGHHVDPQRYVHRGTIQ